ncbi:MAG: AtpZ/AtpI family protein [Gemmatimonadetes bacterium]|nr:AtpZ/AtpI family protein [Gemmatimonadota bacterium]
MRESKPSGDVSPWALAGLGMQFFVAILLFVTLGNWLDRRAGTAPLFLLAGLFLGGGGSFWAAYRRLTGDARSAPPPDDANRTEHDER